MKYFTIAAMLFSGISYSYEYKQLSDMQRFGNSQTDSSILFYRINNESKSDPFPTFNLSTISAGKLNIMIGDLDCKNSSSWLKIVIVMNQDKLESMENVSGQTKFENFQSTGVFGKMCRDIETKPSAHK